MASMAVVDGHVDPKERYLIARVAQRKVVPPARVEALIAAAERGELDLPMPADPQEARRWLESMASAALADGNLSREEHALLRRTGQRIGLADYDVRLLLNRTRTEALEKAKGALKTGRKARK